MSEFINELMSGFFTTLLSQTLGLSGLILLVIGIRPWVLKYLNAHSAYLLWLMLPLFLLMPVSFFEQSANSPVMTFLPNAKTIFVSDIIGRLLSESYFELLVFSFWLCGTFIFLINYAVKYQKLKRSLVAYDYSLPNQQVTHKASFKPHLVAIKNSKLIDVPAVFGLFEAFLILPQNFCRLAKEKQLMILRHEFYHLARRDHQVNFLRICIKSLFWFNPLVYWADKVIEADQEISCDLGVLNASPHMLKKSYAAALIESVAGINQNNLVSQWKYQSLIKERVKMLKNTKQKIWHSWVAGVFAISSVWVATSVVAGEKTQAKIDEAVPLAVINPLYPRQAVTENIEGFVQMSMNIDSQGKPYDIQVINSQPKVIFDKDAMKAMSQWKFKPRVVNGKAEAQHDMRYTMQFKLTDDEASDAVPLPKR